MPTPVQGAEGTNFSGDNFTSIATSAFASPVVAGRAIVVWATWQNGTTTCTITDSQGNTYTAVGSQIEGGGGVLGAFIAPNIAGGAGNIVTMTLSAARQYGGIVAVEFSDVASTFAAAVLGNSGNAQATPTTGANATTSGAAAPSAAPTTQVAFSFCPLGSPPPAAGTGFTTGGNAIAGAGTLEYRARADTSSVASTFTAAQNSIHLTQQMFLAPASTPVDPLSYAGASPGFLSPDALFGRG